MKYLYNIEELILLESKIYFTDELDSGISKILSGGDDDDIDEVVDKLNRINGKDINSKRLNKESEYILDIGDSPNMIKMFIVRNGVTKESEIKIGRLLSILLPETPDHIKSEISNKWKSYFDYENRGEIKLINDEIDYWYNCSNYTSNSGTLGNSCMKYTDSDRFEIYNYNDSIRLLILVDDDNELLARSIVFFDTNYPKPIMNTIYSVDETDVETLKLYGHKKGWVYIDKINEDNLRIYLEKSHFDKYPYIDSVPYLNKTKDELSGSDNMEWSKSDEIILLQDHEYGFWTPIRNSEVPPNENWKKEITSWRDIEYCLLPNSIIDNGIDFNDFLEKFLEDEIEYRIESYSDIYGGEDLIKYLNIKFGKYNDTRIIKFAINNGFDIKSYIEDQEFDIDSINEILSQFYKEEIKFSDEEGITEINKLIKDKILQPDLIEAMIDRLYITIDDIREYISDNYKDILSNDETLLTDMVTHEMTNRYSQMNGYYSVTDILYDRFGDIEDLSVVKDILDNEWDRDLFINNIENTYEESEIISCLFG